MKIGFFGGTFDPPHLGHLAVAHAAIGQYLLDRLLIAPTGRQPLKQTPPAASYTDRLAMVKILAENLPRAEASNLEAPRPSGEPNFTIDTLTQLHAEFGPAAHLFVVTGVDAFLGLRQWREPERLLGETEWIVVSRAGMPPGHLESLALSPDQEQRVHFLDGIHVPASATEIRSRLHAGRDVHELLPADVLAYIQKHHLYGQ